MFSRLGDPFNSTATQSYKVVNTSGALFTDCGGRPSRQYTVKTTLCPYAEMRVCVPRGADASYQALTPATRR